MIVLKQKKITFINKCNCIVDYDLLEKAMLWFANGKLQYNKKTIYLYGIYPAVSIYEKKIHVHRLLLLYTNLDKVIASSDCCHHKNGIKTDCRITNLELIHNVIHASIHNSGKVLSPEHRWKIGIANMKRIGIKYKTRNITTNKTVPKIVK